MHDTRSTLKLLSIERDERLAKLSSQPEIDRIRTSHARLDSHPSRCRTAPRGQREKLDFTGTDQLTDHTLRQRFRAGKAAYCRSHFDDKETRSREVHTGSQTGFVPSKALLMVPVAFMDQGNKDAGIDHWHRSLAL